MALAYFITFTTYGTWLHGTEKGKGSVDDEHNEFGTSFLPGDAERLHRERSNMAQPTYVMSAPEREIVLEAIVSLAGEKGWQLLAVHVRSNHVHIVVSIDRDAGRVMSDFKARASRELARAGHGDSQRRRWTRHGSALHLFDETAVAAKIRYTLDGQGVPMARYDGSQQQTPHEFGSRGTAHEGETKGAAHGGETKGAAHGGGTPPQ